MHKVGKEIITSSALPPRDIFVFLLHDDGVGGESGFRAIEAL